MTQTVPATAVLGPGKTGLAIGLRVLNLDGTVYAAFSAVGVAETSTAGTYRKASGVTCPDAGAYIVWGEAATDYAEATVDSVYGLITGTKNTLDSLLTALQGAGWTDETLVTLAALVDAIKAKTDGLPASPADQSAVEGAITAATAGLATGAEVAALNDITVADIIAGIREGSLDLQEMLRVILAAAAGKASGGGTTEVTFRDQADTKDRIVMTVDEDGNRTAVTVDGS